MPLKVDSLKRSTAARIGIAGAAVATVAATAVIAPATADTEKDAALAKLSEAPAVPAVQTLSKELGLSPAKALARLQLQERQASLADRLREQLDTRSAGAWIKQTTGELVVNVTNQAAAERVRQTSATPNIVAHSQQELEAAKAKLDKLSKRIAGEDRLSWGVDVTKNAVVITVPDSSTDPQTRAFVRKAKSLAAAIMVEHVDGAPRTHAFYGGQAIYGGGSRCSAGFVAESGGTQYVITAGHCTNIASSWTDGGQTVGSTVESSFPGNDFGLIQISDPGALDPQGAVLNNGSAQDITGASQVPVGSTVCKTGSTTGTTCGQVLAYDVTVNYAQGSVEGLTETDVCTQGGDSGGPLFAGSEAQGITSGGTTVGCDSSSFRSYFQPVDEALSAYGLTLK